MDNPSAELAAALRRVVRGEVRFDPYSRVLYSTDASSYQIEPVGVVIPRTLEDVHAAVETALQFGVPILGRGGGSSLAGQAIGRALIIDFSKHLNRVLEMNAEAGWVRAEPGLVCDALNAAARPHGWMYGCEPASSNRATVGGMIMNNSTGAHSVLYGMTADQVVRASVILSDGTAAQFGPLDAAAHSAKIETEGLEGDIYRETARLIGHYADAIRERYPRTWRRASGYALNYLLPPNGFTASRPAGWDWANTQTQISNSQTLTLTLTPNYPAGGDYNLAKLLAGSEGTLAVLTEATLKLVRRPKMTALCVVHFDSVEASADAVPAILEARPSAVELLDAVMLDLTRGIPAYARMLDFVQGRPAAILVVEFYGDSEAELQSKVSNLEEGLQGSGLAKTFVRAMTPAEQANVWGVRKVGLGLLMSVRGDSKPLAFMEDVAVPVERLGEYVRGVQRIFDRYNIRSAYYAHASAGCLHIRPSLNLKDAREIGVMREVAQAVLELVIGLGGAMSGEHGDGLSRSCWNERLYGPELYRAFHELKRAFDPRGLLNPGKIVGAQDIVENLRYGARYRTIPVQTHLDFGVAGGFARAVEQCNGAGVCRKHGDGAMCPSFMATREEEHSTRGRANALRAALSGRLPPEALTEERMYRVMELCLECKACKAECPSAVDMAKIKYEFLAQYQAAHGVPLRSRFFANINRVSRLAHRVAPVVNFTLGLPPVRWANEKALGIPRQRRLPAFASRSFLDWHRQYRRERCARDTLRVLRSSPPAEGAGGPPRQVLLFADTFTNYNHPEVGAAAVKVLDALGYEALTPPHVCCGRPMISKGLLEQARAHAGRNVAVLAPFAEKGVPILGLEPSCLLTLRDEYLDLLPNDPHARLVAEKAVMIEEFLAEQPPLPPPPMLHASRSTLYASRPILVHAHCYQKALVGSAPLLAMLRLTGREVSEIPSGCCGMAGSFGYEAEHYELSLKIGEDRLFPAVRAAGEGAEIAAAGFSCRHQIAHATGRLPKHPIEILAEAL